MQRTRVDTKFSDIGTIGRAGAGPPIPCCSIPAFVGPERGGIRSWRGTETLRNAGAISSGAEADHVLAAIGGGVARQPDAKIVRLRKALRRERLLGRSGACGYSVERHSALRRALDRAASGSDGECATDRVLH